MVSITELWLQVKPGMKFFYIQTCQSTVNFPHKSQWRGALVFDWIEQTTVSWWVETPSRSLWRHCIADPLNKPFSLKINVSCVEIRMFRVKGLNTMTSFVASPGCQYPQYCKNVIHNYIQSLKKGLNVWLLKVRHRPGPASWFFSDFVRICAVYQWVVHIISDFVLSYKM